MTRTQRQRAARDRAEARLAGARRARTRRRVLVALTGIGAVIAVVAALVVVRLTSASSHSAPVATGRSSPTGVARAQILTEVTAVPASTLDAVGQGTAAGLPAPIHHATPLLAGDKPELLYVGAEWCRFCAAERWAMIVALGRFGTFSGLGLIDSAGHDTRADIATLTFHGSTYTSDYLVFSPVETQTTDHATLDTPTPDEQRLMNTYDAPPYVDASSAGAIPFLDFGNRYLVSGSSYDPAVLAGMSWQDIASSLADPSDPVARSIDGAANTLTAAICQLTGDQPAAVCTGRAVAPLTAKL